MKKLKIIKSFISVGNYQSFLEAIFGMLNEKKSSYVCVSNIMVPFFKTSKTISLISPFYDTSGNSFALLESKLLSA